MTGDGSPSRADIGATYLQTLLIKLLSIITDAPDASPKPRPA